MKRLGLLFLLLALSGCGYRNVPAEDFLKVKEGMTKDEVILILDKPIGDWFEERNGVNLNYLTYRVRGDWWMVVISPVDYAPAEVVAIAKWPDDIQELWNRLGPPTTFEEAVEKALKTGLQ